MADGRRQIAISVCENSAKNALKPAVPWPETAVSANIIRNSACRTAIFRSSCSRWTRPAPAAAERVEFRVAVNPGIKAGPLNKVASGGELSRISLAIQVAASADGSTPVMIFDEVDAGVGGGTADIVGSRLRQLADNVQVLCVTHLPQVASKGPWAFSRQQTQ